MTQKEKLIELLRNAPKTDTVYGNIKLSEPVQTLRTIADHLLANGVIVPPVKVGDWVWYVFENECNKAKVEEMNFSSSKHGYYSCCFDIYAYDFKNKRSVAWHPVNETMKNKSDVSEVEGVGYVDIFLTREEAEKALAERLRKDDEGK